MGKPILSTFAKAAAHYPMLKKSAVQRYGPVSRVFDGPSETTILQRVPRLGPGYAAIISIRALAGLNLLICAPPGAQRDVTSNQVP
jgi:hypothetical protein